MKVAPETHKKAEEQKAAGPRLARKAAATLQSNALLGPF
jgi:hypothetical protein